jgi:hypothetical protein
VKPMSEMLEKIKSLAGQVGTLLILCITLFGCAGPDLPASPANTKLAERMPPTNLPASPSLSASPATAQPSSTPGPCFYNWGYEAAPTQDASYRANLEAAGFQNFSVSVGAFGETLNGPGCHGFLIMDYEAKLSIIDQTVTDREMLGDLVAKVVMVPTSAIVFLSIQGQGVSFSGKLRPEDQALVKSGLKGSALLEKLSSYKR